jgi:hypothetical protein
VKIAIFRSSPANTEDAGSYILLKKTKYRGRPHRENITYLYADPHAGTDAHGAEGP